MPIWTNFGFQIKYLSIFKSCLLALYYFAKVYDLSNCLQHLSQKAKTKCKQTEFLRASTYMPRIRFCYVEDIVIAIVVLCVSSRLNCTSAAKCTKCHKHHSAHRHTCDFHDHKMQMKDFFLLSLLPMHIAHYAEKWNFPTPNFIQNETVTIHRISCISIAVLKNNIDFLV